MSKETDALVDSTFDVIDTMARIRASVNRAKQGKISAEQALDYIEQYLDRYEQGEILWAADRLGIEPDGNGYQS